jgi:hypothetical protein
MHPSDTVHLFLFLHLVCKIIFKKNPPASKGVVVEMLLVSYSVVEVVVKKHGEGDIPSPLSWWWVGISKKNLNEGRGGAYHHHITFLPVGGD